jgi:hypothetical protein
VPGGVLSLLIYAFMICYILFSVNKLLFYGDNKNSTQVGLDHGGDEEVINYNETNLFNFFVIRKQLEGNGPVWFGPEMESYIHVSFGQ